MLDRDHLSAAHRLWATVVRPGDRVVDATLGRGRDALRLAELCKADTDGELIGLDIQAEAVEASRKILAEFCGGSLSKNIRLHAADHSTFPEDLGPASVRLVVYNLGYLPGGDESLITRTESTLRSLQAALELLAPGGLISCTCYSGHPGGDHEEAAVLAWASALPRRSWTVSHTRWVNRRNGPSLLLIQKVRASP